MGGRFTTLDAMELPPDEFHMLFVCAAGNNMAERARLKKLDKSKG